MYNEELKTKFVKGYTSSVSTARVCQNIFNAFQPYEEKWDADLCTKSSEELQPVIDSIVGFRVRSKWMRLIILKDYVKWCINAANVPDACDGMLKINAVGLDKVKLQTVASPLHLQKYLNTMYVDESLKTADNRYRCYYWLAYGGVKEEDIMKIKCSDVDFQNMVVRYNNNPVTIYREAIPAFKNCVELTQFVFDHPGYTKTVWKERASGDELVRGLNQTTSIKAMRVALSKRAKPEDSKDNKDNKDDEKKLSRLSYYRTWISGVFYRAYEKELAGEEPDFSDVVSQQMEGKIYKLDSGRNTLSAKKRQLMRDYMEDYQRWKLAFKI